MSITKSAVVRASIEDVFAWHERPGALARLVPPWQPIRVGREPVNLRDGRAELLLPGGLRWVAQHHDYAPPHRFADDLVSLPLPWRHWHEFSAPTPQTTRVMDRVDTPVPGACLRATFDYRHRQLADDLDVSRAAARLRPEPLTVAITGASGLVGAALVALLGTCGHRPLRLVRRRATTRDERTWQPDDPDPRLLDGVDALVHLAGAPIAGRFTSTHMKAIEESRVGPTRRLAELLAASSNGPRVVICASAIGYYGPNRGDDMLDEQAERGDGFLADVVDAWEAATLPAAEAGTRVVTVRTGIVQSPRGGALRLLRPLFTAGLGGPLSPGTQWTSWIDLDDLTDIYLRALVDDTIAGPVNATAPSPVPSRDYAATLGAVLHRPSVLTVPSAAPKLLLGDAGAREVALASQRVLPARLLAIGHRFRRPKLDDCLRHQLGRMAA
jgi:uncharacterized protein